MSDCPNAEIRDRLPDLLHERLDARARAEALAHVDGCADCRAELELLREAFAILAEAPRVNVGAIVRALPSSASVRRATAPVRSRRFDWRVAASIAALIVGGASIGTYASIGRNVHEAAIATPTSAVKPAIAPLDSIIRPGQPAESAGSPAVVATTGATAASAAHGDASAELATGDGLGDMSAGELQELASDIGKMQPLPPADPDTVIVTAPEIGSTEDN